MPKTIAHIHNKMINSTKIYSWWELKFLRPSNCQYMVCCFNLVTFYVKPMVFLQHYTFAQQVFTVKLALQTIHYNSWIIEQTIFLYLCVSPCPSDCQYMVCYNLLILQVKPTSLVRCVPLVNNYVCGKYHSKACYTF